MPITKKKYNELYKEYLEQGSQNYVDNYQEPVTLSSAKNKSYQATKQRAEAQNQLKSYMQSQGVKTGNNMYSAPTALQVQTDALKTNLLLSDAEAKRKGESLSFQNQAKKNEENLKKYQTASNTEESKTLKKNVISARNEESLAKSQEQQLQSAKDFNNMSSLGQAYEKSIGRVAHGFWNTVARNNNYYTDENGKTYTLTNYGESLNQVINNNYKTTAGRWLGNAFYSVGEQIPSMIMGEAASGIAKGMGATAKIINTAKQIGSLGYMFLNVADKTTNEIKKEYGENQASQYALASAAIEVGTELLFGGMGKIFGTGALDEVATKKVTQNIKNGVLRNLAEAGVSSLGEGIEEVVSSALTPLIDKFVLNKDINYWEEFFSKDTVEDFIIGTLSSIIMSAPSTVASFNSTDTKINDAIVDVQNQSRDNNKKVQLNTEDRENISNAVYEQGKNLNENQLVDLTKEITKNYITEKYGVTFENALKNNTKAIQDNTKAINKLVEERNKAKDSTTISELNNQIQTLAQENINLNKSNEQTTQNVNLPGLNQNVAETSQKQVNLPGLEQNNQLKQNIVDINTRLSAENLTPEAKFLESARTNNINTADQGVRDIGKLASLRNMSIEFDNTMSNGQNAVWYETKDNNGNTVRKIAINPNTKTNLLLQQIIVHEAFHDIAASKEGKELIKEVLDYTKKNTNNYYEMLQDLANTYAQITDNSGNKVYDRSNPSFETMIDEEAAASIIANKLGNQEFINRLVSEKPNVARRLYNKIKELINKLTGKENKTEREFWENVADKFEKAFKSDYVSRENNSKLYDIISNGKYTWVKASRQVIKGNDPLKWETQVENYINEEIRKSNDVNVLNSNGDVLTITEETAGKAKFRNIITDAYGNTRYLSNKEFLTKLGAEVHIDELAKTSKKTNKKIVPDSKNHNFAKDGFNYYRTYFEDYNGDYYEIIMSVGKNGNINTIYNVGKLIKTQKKGNSNLVGQSPNSQKTISNAVSSKKNIPQNNQNVKYSAENTNIQDKINQSFTMDEVKSMIERGFINAGIYNYTDGEIKNAEQWFNETDIDEISMYLENDEGVIGKYINRLYERDNSFGEDYSLEDILEAYKNGTLTGKVAKQRTNLDTTKQVEYNDERFYAPKKINYTKEMYDTANQRLTNTNRNEVYKSRADFIMAYQNGDISTLGLDTKEITQKLKSWANYPQRAFELSQKLNENVAPQNRWSGIENSSIVNQISVTDEQMSKMVKKIIGKSDEFKRQYITATMLAIDTHTDFSRLTFDFEQKQALRSENALGDYDNNTDTIRIGDGYQNTVAHEMGHYLDYQWARELGLNYYLSENRNNSKIDTLTEQQRQFVNNFQSFIENLENSGYIGNQYSSSGRGGTYWQSSRETFARFVGKFVEWTKNQATNNRYGYEDKHYSDKFTENQYKEFVKLLQEKSMLDTTTPKKYGTYNQETIKVMDSINEEQLNKIRDILNSDNGAIPSYQITEQLMDVIGKDNYFKLTREQLQELAKVDNRYSTETQTWQEFLDNNFKNEGTGKTIKELKLPKTETNLPGVKKQIAYETKKQGKELTLEVKKLTDEKVANLLTVSPENPKDGKMRLAAMLRSNIFDKGAVFEDLSLKTKNRELMAKWDGILSAEAKGQYAIGNGHGKDNSLRSMRETVYNSGLEQQFSDYMYNLLNIDRMTLSERYFEEGISNKPVFNDEFTAEMSKEITDKYEKDYPQFKEWRDNIYEYLNNDKAELVKNGVISQETADLWKEMYPHYVPIGRVIDKGTAINVPLDTRRTGINSPVKKAKGGNQDILPMFDTIAKRTLQTYKATAKNKFGVELYNTLNQQGFTEKIGLDEAIENIDNQDTLLKEGTNNALPTLTVFVDGQKTTFSITEDMYYALKPTSELLSKTAKLPNKIMSYQRGVLTEYNPVFMLTNAIKDAQDVLINSQHALKTYSKFGEAYQQILKKGYYYNEYVKNGGESNTYFDKKSNTFSNGEEKGITATLPLRKISEINNVIEMAPRLAEYIASRESGRSIEVSMLDAARVTTNFKAGGDFAKFLNRNGATFLNASIQGLNQQIRNIREAQTQGFKGYLGLATKFAIAGLLAEALNHMLWDDDDEFEQLSDYVKNNYYIVAKKKDGTFIRIPKGRTLAVIQNAFNQVFKKIEKDEDIDLNEFAQLFANNIAPNNPIENNVLSPLIQAATNKAWYGGELLPKRLQNKETSEQYDESTDEFSKWVGKILNLSPYKVNYVLNQYSGGIGDVILPMITKQTANGADSVLGYVTAPLADKFSTNSILNNKYVSKIYDTSEKLTIAAGKDNATSEDIVKNKYINSVKAEMNNLYKEKREVQMSDINKKDKYTKVLEIQQQIDDLAKNALNEIGKVNIDGVYAKIGNREYRLDTKTDGSEEWTKLNDTQMAKQNAFVKSTNLSANDYWKYYENISNISSDKDSNGNTITNSKKNKTINYINSLPISAIQKAILIKTATNYKFTNYDNQIISYVNNKKLSVDEKTEILSALGFTVKNGRVY